MELRGDIVNGPVVHFLESNSDGTFEDAAFRNRFLEGCKRGELPADIVIEDVSRPTLDFGFQYAAWSGHTDLVSSLVGRVSHKKVEEVLSEPQDLLKGVIDVLSQHVSNKNQEREEFFRACVKGDILTIQRLGRSVSTGVLLEGFRKAVDFNEDNDHKAALCLFSLLDPADQISVFKGVLESGEQNLIFKLARVIKLENLDALNDVFVGECRQGRLLNVNLLRCFMHDIILRNGCQIAIKAGKYDVVDYLVRDDVIGHFFAKEMLNDALQEGGSRELILCLFKHLNHYAEVRDFFLMACVKGRVDVVKSVLEIADTRYREGMILEGMSQAAFYEKGEAVLRYLAGGVSPYDLGNILVTLSGCRSDIEKSVCVLSWLWTTRPEQEERRDDRFLEWRHGIICDAVRAAVNVNEVDKVRLLVPYVKDMRLLKRLLVFALSHEDADLVNKIVHRIDRNFVIKMFIRVMQQEKAGSVKLLAPYIAEPLLLNQLLRFAVIQKEVDLVVSSVKRVEKSVIDNMVMADIEKESVDRVRFLAPYVSSIAAREKVVLFAVAQKNLELFRMFIGVVSEEVKLRMIRELQQQYFLYFDVDRHLVAEQVADPVVCEMYSSLGGAVK